MGKIVRAFINLIFILLALVILAGGGLITYLTVQEYRPRDQEALTAAGTARDSLSAGDSVSVISWNIGYGGLSKTADFFMDGGVSVRSQPSDQVRANIEAVSRQLSDTDPDLICLQEIDRDSDRSFRHDQTAMVVNALQDYAFCFAGNFRVPFIPYPFPPIGKVDSGIMTLSRFDIEEAERVALPCPFSWPVRVANLKRCLLVSRIPVGDSGKYLVLVNAHLEAYDDGSGKEAQTAMLRELMEAEYEKGNYVIVTGDFNQSFSNIDTSAYPLRDPGLWQCGILDTEAFSDRWQFLMDTSAPTCRSLDRPYDGDRDRFQFYMIDGFIVSDNLTVTSMETMDLDFENSDHNPVLLTVQIPEK